MRTILSFLLGNYRLIFFGVLGAVYGYAMMSIGEWRIQARWDKEKAEMAEQREKDGEKAHAVGNKVRALPVGDSAKQLQQQWSRD